MELRVEDLAALPMDEYRTLVSAVGAHYRGVKVDLPDGLTDWPDKDEFNALVAEATPLRLDFYKRADVERGRGRREYMRDYMRKYRGTDDENVE